MSETEKKPEEKRSIFRKKSLDRISSPEELDSYLTVTGPGVWFPLLTVVCLLVGLLVWMAFGQIDTTLAVAVQASDAGVVCYVPYDRKDAVTKAGEIRIADRTYPVSDVGLASLVVSEELDSQVRRAGSLALGAVVAPVRVEGDFMPGVYAGEIVVETIHPIQFIIN